MTDEFIKRTRDFLNSRDKSKPFFLYFASQCIHVPRVPNPRFRGKSQLSFRGDSMVEFDWATGQILKMLDDQGLSDNTIVIFSSDNGPVYDDGYDDGTTVPTSRREVDRGHDASGPYRGGKYQIYEGGTRVPFIVRWPGRIKPGKTSALFNQIDLIASFADLLGIELAPEQAIDSRNALNTLLGKDENGMKYTLEETNHMVALRQNYWKYIINLRKKNAHAELYNLKDDVGEKHNVIKQHPEIAKQMHTLLMKLFNAKDGIRKASSQQ
jgi:arylsulfatase A-like enzyme